MKVDSARGARGNKSNKSSTLSQETTSLATLEGIDQVLRYVVLTGIFALPFVPLIVANSFFFPFITGKHFFFRIVVEIVFAAWLILALRNPQFRPRFDVILYAFSAFMGIIFLADLFGENPFKSFWSNFERMEGFITLLHLFLYTLTAASVVTTERLWGALANTSLGVSLVMVGYAFLQFSGALPIHQGSVRVDATIGNAAYFAAYLLFHIFITAILFVRVRRGFFVRSFYGVALALQIVALFLTATRGAILGLMGGAFLTTLLLAMFERESPWVRRSAAGILCALLITVGGFFFVKDSDVIKNNAIFSRLADISLKSGETRFAIWSLAWEGVKEKPLLGYGQESFNIVFNRYYTADLYLQEPWFDRVHNIVLDWLIAGGFLGALAYFAIPLLALYLLWGRRGCATFSSSERSVITGLLAGYFFQNLFVFDQLVTYLYYFSILAYISARMRPTQLPTRLESLHVSPGTLQASAVVISVVACVGLYVLNVKSIQANVSLIGALYSTQTGNVEHIVDAFAKATSFDVVGRQEAVEQLAFATAGTLGHPEVSEQDKMRLYALAKTELEKELAYSREQDARLYMFYGAIVRQAGQLSLAESALRRAYELSPQKPMIVLDLAPLLAAQGKGNEALALCADLIEKLPQYYEARVMCGMTALYSNDVATAQLWLAPYQGTDGVEYKPADDARVRAFSSSTPVKL